MPEIQRNFHAYNGTKLWYATTDNEPSSTPDTASQTDWTQIACITSAPDIGGEPNDIDTTNLDNTEYETAILGLKPVQKYTFEFNLEDPASTANMYLASQLEDNGTDAWWYYKLSNGIVVKFQSKVSTTILGGGSQDLLKFSMTLAPKSEPTVVITV
jgi:hypothetical protein